jgi:hypothetical protein
VELKIKNSGDTPVEIFGCIEYSSTKVNRSYYVSVVEYQAKSIIPSRIDDTQVKKTLSGECVLIIEPHEEYTNVIDLGEEYDRVCNSFRNGKYLISARIATYVISKESESVPIYLITNKIEVQL